MNINVGSIKQLLKRLLTIILNLLQPDAVNVRWLVCFLVIDNDCVFIDTHEREVTFSQIISGHSLNFEQANFFSDNICDENAMLALHL